MKKEKSLILAHKLINLFLYSYVLIGILLSITPTTASGSTTFAKKPHQKIDTLIIEKQIKRYVIDTTRGIGREVQNITNKINGIEAQFTSYNSELKEFAKTKNLLIVSSSEKDTLYRAYVENIGQKIDSIAIQTEILNQITNDMGARIERAENIALKNSANYNSIKMLLIFIAIFLFIIIVLLASQIGRHTNTLKTKKPTVTPLVSPPGQDVPLYKKTDQLQTMEKQNLASDRQSRLPEQTTQDTLVKAMSKIENTLASLSKDIKGKKISQTDTKDFHKNIYELRDAGNTQEEIAKKLNIGKGEVELVLNLRKKGYTSQQEADNRQ